MSVEPALIDRPKLAAEPSSPSIVMWLLFLISTMAPGAFFHCVQGSGMEAKTNPPFYLSSRPPVPL